MVIERRWVRPGTPLLTDVSKWLLEQAERLPNDQLGALGQSRNLSNWLCVVRGRRAGRMLLRALLDTAASRGLIPPRIVTQGGMVEQLLDTGRPVATPIECTMAWMAALRDSPPETLAPLMSDPPERDDWSSWHRLAQTIGGLHEELAGEGVTLATAADRADAMAPLEEGNRWRVLADLLDRYHAALADAGLVDVHASRWESATSPETAAQHWAGIALIGVLELNAIQRAALTAARTPIHAFVHADELMQPGFDAWGCVRHSFWREREIALGEVNVVLADRPADQAQAVMQAMAALDGMRAPEEIVIGVGSDALRPDIARAAMWADVAVHDSEGTAVSRTPAARLLTAMADALDDARFAHFATLVRHADLGVWLQRAPDETERGVFDWISLLDRYFADHLQQRFSGEYLGAPARAAALRVVHERVRALLEPLKGPDRERGAWLGPIADVLTAVYPDATARERHGADAVIDAMAAVASLPAPLQPVLSGPAAIRMLLRECSDTPVPGEPRREAVEMLGWLELHPDPAPVLIVAGVNEGDIPATTKPGPFLPDSMRAALGLACNDTRYARDACLLETHIRAGKSLTLITGRRSLAGDPLTPSRLLLACAEDELPCRVTMLFGEPPGGGLPLGSPEPAAESQFVVPPLPVDLAPPTSMRVTDFRLYLTCPYRFALDRLLRLDAVTDRVAELDAMQFGTLAHQVLCEFGMNDAMRDVTDVETIVAFLIDNLKSRARRTFGDFPLASVRVQLAQLEHRLRGFAAFEAQSRREGWRIAHCEHALGDDAVLDVPGDVDMPIHGTIDRIDRHERTGTWRIIDYKSGDSGKGPIEAHHNGRTRVPVGEVLEWSDLQLPLYHYLARRSALGMEGDIELGFIVLPRQSDGVAWKVAPWGPEALASAIECARDVVKRIRAGDFTRNVRLVTAFDPFARICQSMVLTSGELDAETESELA